MTTTTSPGTITAVLDARRGLLKLEPSAGAFAAVVVTIPGISGALVAGTEADAREVLAMLDGLLHRREHYPPPCECGELRGRHRVDLVKQTCELTGCPGYRPVQR